MKWKKGQSGNPSGRPKGAKGLAKYIQQQTQDGRDLADFVLAVARGQEIPTNYIGKKDGLPVVHRPTLSDRQWAINFLANRGFGKPLETIEVADITENTRTLTQADLDAMDPIQLKAVEALLLEATGELTGESGKKED